MKETFNAFPAQRNDRAPDLEASAHISPQTEYMLRITRPIFIKFCEALS